MEINQEVFIVNRRNQQKRARVLDIKDNLVLTTGSDEYIAISDIRIDKLILDKVKERTTDCLEPEEEFDKQMFGRDSMAHLNRWSYISRKISNSRVLDLGCGSGNLALHLYKNRNKQIKYLGIDFDAKNLANAVGKLTRKTTGDIPDWIEFIQTDLTKELKLSDAWDTIVCFETLEHIGVDNADILLKNILSNATDETDIYLSTPVYSHAVGAFSGHVINGEVNEYTYKETKALLEKDFKILDVFGTFASIPAIEKVMSPDELSVYKKLRTYYGTGEIAWMYAPLFPEQSRNCLWHLRKKKSMKFKYYTKPNFTVQEVEPALYKKLDISYRKGTSDRAMISDCLVNYSCIDICNTDVVLDLGSNIGAFGKMCLDNSCKKVICVEPDQFNFDVLEHNIGKDVNAILYKNAVVGDDSKFVNFAIKDNNNGACSAKSVSFTEKTNFRVDKIPTINFDYLLESYRPSVVKIDIESAEYYVVTKSLPEYVRTLSLELHGFTKMDYLKMMKTFVDLQQEWDIILLRPEYVFNVLRLINVVFKRKAVLDLDYDLSYMDSLKLPPIELIPDTKKDQDFTELLKIEIAKYSDFYKRI